MQQSEPDENGSMGLCLFVTLAAGRINGRLLPDHKEPGVSAESSFHHVAA
jgi:hypothetical protein